MAHSFFEKDALRDAFKAAFPIVLGYVGIGIPCGVLSSAIGLNWIQVLLMCLLFYSGAGQFMIPNMWIAAASIPSIIASVSFVNTRQILYATVLGRYCHTSGKRLSILFAATVTDESFGINIKKLQEGNWDINRALFVNLISQTSWTVSCLVGVIVGDLLSIPTAIAAFAMTSIFICLLFNQKFNSEKIVAAIFAILGVIVLKSIGLSGPAVFFAALIGVFSAWLFSYIKRKMLHDEY